MPKKNRGLGKGLDALLRTDKPAEKQIVKSLPIDKVIPQKNQPRKNFDEKSLSELAASIAKHGLLQPILVRANTEGQYEIIAGERRWRAVKQLGQTEIPALIKAVSEQDQSEMALIENLQREDLNILEEADAYKHLIEVWGYTQEKVAQAIGKSRPYVSNTMRLLQLPSQIRSWLANGALTAGHARTLLTIKDEQKQLALARNIIAAQLSVRAAEDKTRTKAQTTPVTAPDVQAWQEKMESYFGSRIRLKSEKKGGKIEIFYENSDDFLRILGLLGLDEP